MCSTRCMFVCACVCFFSFRKCESSPSHKECPCVCCVCTRLCAFCVWPGTTPIPVMPVGCPLGTCLLTIPSNPTHFMWYVFEYRSKQLVVDRFLPLLVWSLAQTTAYQKIISFFRPIHDVFGMQLFFSHFVLSGKWHNTICPAVLFSYLCLSVPGWVSWFCPGHSDILCGKWPRLELLRVMRRCEQ